MARMKGKLSLFTDIGTGPYLFTFIGSQCLETSYSDSLYVMYGLHLLFCRGKVVGFRRLHQMVIQETRQNK